MSSFVYKGGKMFFYLFAGLLWQLQLPGQPEQEPQEQELLPCFLFIIPLTTMAIKIRAMIDATMIVGKSITQTSFLWDKYYYFVSFFS